jgi:hypothetical protein
MRRNPDTDLPHSNRQLDTSGESQTGGCAMVWVAVFAISVTASIGLTIAAAMMQPADGRRRQNEFGRAQVEAHPL